TGYRPELVLSSKRHYNQKMTENPSLHLWKNGFEAPHHLLRILQTVHILHWPPFHLGTSPQPVTRQAYRKMMLRGRSPDRLPLSVDRQNGNRHLSPRCPSRSLEW